MSFVAVILLLLSAFTHAGWNFISKREQPTLSFYRAANLFGTLCILPLYFTFVRYSALLSFCAMKQTLPSREEPVPGFWTRVLN